MRSDPNSDQFTRAHALSGGEGDAELRAIWDAALADVGCAARTSIGYDPFEVFKIAVALFKRPEGELVPAQPADPTDTGPDSWLRALLASVPWWKATGYEPPTLTIERVYVVDLLRRAHALGRQYERECHD